VNKTKIDGYLLRAMVLTSASKLEIEKSQIDSLNVFPVPDGDTGTNMSLTLASAAKAVEGLSEKAGLADVAEAMAYGALMGARGNSGVILSQLLGGFTKAVNNHVEMDAQLLATAFSKGVAAAYKAVVKPIEGTILTVAREASEKLFSKVNENIDIVKAFEIFLNQGYNTLAMTPEMLPVLKQAGVVDAGGKGFLTVIEGMLAGFKGEKFEGILNESENYLKKASLPLKDFEISEENIEFQYCTELIIKKFKKSQEVPDDIRNFLEQKGDCVLVVPSDDIIKIHVHTNNPGLVLEFCCEIGSLHDIKIENMREQSQELQLSAPKKNLGVIAVSVGEGLNEIFKSLGVDYIITGGQTMNPSTEDILSAIEEVNAEEIIILPNNKNIILAAEQAVAISSKTAKVVTSKTIPQGIGALMAFNGELDLNTNLEKMMEATKHIKTGEVTYAVRDAQHGNLQIKAGQIIGIIDGEISVIAENTADVVVKILEQLLKNNEELVTLYFGKETSETQAQKLVDKLASFYSDIDFELHYGGQPLYHYLISIE